MLNERISRLDLRGFDDGHIIYFCNACDWQYKKPNAAMVPFCPNCNNRIHYVKCDEEVKKLVTDQQLKDSVLLRSETKGWLKATRLEGQIAWLRINTRAERLRHTIKT